MSTMSESEKFYVKNDITRQIQSALGQSYPYKAGSVTLKTKYYTKEETKYILQYCLDKKFPVEINYVKSEIKISGYINSI
jgi:hypothetical protein